MGPKSSAAGIVALLIAVAVPACGGSSDETTTTSPPVALERCVRSGPVTQSGYNWGAKVRGVSCDRVGWIIRHKAFRHSPQVARTTHFQAAGYACDSSKLRASLGGWRVGCVNGDHRFTFELTP